MICISGASGTLGREVLRQLQSVAPVRATFFSSGGAEAARASGIDAVQIDYNRPDSLRTAFNGCDRLFLLGPNAINQVELELNAIEAAKAAGVAHIVKQSVMAADDQAYTLAKIHREAEKAIESSGLRWTFLRPNSFMQNAVTFMSPSIQAESAFYSASDNAKISHVDVRDIAAVAVKALTEPAHEGKAYTLTGPQAMSYDDLAAELSRVVGRTIRHVNLSPDDLKAGMLGAGTPEPIVERLLDLERFFREGHASVVTNDIKKVTGKSPTSYAQYLRDIAPTGIWNAAPATT